MTILKIDRDDLILALTSAEDLHDTHHYLDVQTGAVLYAGEGVEGLPDDLADNPRYGWIEPVAIPVLRQVMAEFVQQLDDRAVAAWLSQALRSDQPTHAFLEALLPFEPQRRAWFVFRDQAYARLAQQWCDNKGWIVEWV